VPAHGPNLERTIKHHPWPRGPGPK
jgi:hypothetical protein